MNTKLSLGLQRGVSDLLLKDHRGLIGIEMKHLGMYHPVKHLIEQAEWILDVCDAGGFIYSLESFKQVVLGRSSWVHPLIVIDFCRKVKTKSVLWDKIIEYERFTHA